MKKIPCNPQVGADVEVFLMDSNAHIVPCVGLIKGTKQKPFRPDGYARGFAVQEDNVMLEFNIPSATYPTVLENLEIAHSMIFQQAADHKLQLNWKPEHTFKPAQLESPQAQTFGCEPDFDAYEAGTMRINPPNFGNTRFCGGHIHLGGDFRCPDFVAALFAELFITFGARLRPNNGSKRRAEWYGRPGVYRPKPYGIEYRTPNNMWAGNLGVASMVLQQAQAVATYLTTTEATRLQKVFKGISWPSVRDYATTGSKEAEAILRSQTNALGLPL